MSAKQKIQFCLIDIEGGQAMAEKMRVCTLVGKKHLEWAERDIPHAAKGQQIGRASCRERV